MRSQQFLESEWDYCLVLDSCRYDVFESVYDEYLDGSLERRESIGSSTPEWAYRTFTGSHDIAYFSGNPFINSLGIPLSELKWGASCDYDWTATDHISNVIDIWREGWDDELGTVPPENMTEGFENHQDAVEEAERTVLHYMQPHAPYLSRGQGGKLGQIKEGINRQAESDGDGGVVSKIGDTVRPKLEQSLEGSSLAQKAGLWLEMDPVELVRGGTRQTAMEYHEQNLRIALEEIVDLIDDLDGDIVVTADHGEAFGEQGVWEHHIETHIPPLIEVPWLEVDGVA
ncbi:hypothetical protein GRX03_08860 [Halovenus sp. WSH3]|uniref:Sulfatase N-terminal domain-containing protein n=1 Tax=Halovenus carboxidivorans TaxID=2692199 RepID=A0A6B0T8Z0_9EURY|nr:hypothetical protein [Halovenus carboxidivorans]MXR51711.1 hypothetical protein [Halovenus carboxidivorans]